MWVFNVLQFLWCLPLCCGTLKTHKHVQMWVLNVLQFLQCLPLLCGALKTHNFEKHGQTKMWVCNTVMFYFAFYQSIACGFLMFHLCANLRKSGTDTHTHTRTKLINRTLSLSLSENKFFDIFFLFFVFFYNYQNNYFKI